MHLATISTKGGTGKTTTAVYVSSVLHRLGPTLLIDCDPQGSALSWSAGLPFQVVSLPVTDVHRRVPDLGAAYEHVVIDTGPGDLGIIRSAILAVPLVVIPVSASGLDIDRLAPTWQLLAEVVDSHPLGVAAAVLLTKVRHGTRSRREARQVLADELDYPVLDTQITLREAYAASFGTMPEDFGEYSELVEELMT